MNPPAKRVLSIDGGGVRGLLPAMILAEIERRTGRLAWELFDVIGGTSTGAFITALATRPDAAGGPIPAEVIASAYLQRGHEFFQRQLNFGLRPKFKSRQLPAILKGYLHDAELAATKTRVIIPVYELRDSLPRIFYFSNLAAGQRTQDNFPLWQVVRAATAAPMIFKAFTVESVDGSTRRNMIDGGIYANNPAIPGWLHAYQHATPQVSAGNFAARFEIPAQTDISDTLVLSLGSGQANEPINFRKARNWGLIQWAPRLLPLVIFEGQPDSTHSQLEIAAAGGLLRYNRRLQPPLDRDIDIGDADALPELQRIGEDYLRSESATIDEICGLLT